MAAPTIRESVAPVTNLVGTTTAATQIGDFVFVCSWERAGAGVPTFTLQSGFTLVRSVSHDDSNTDGRLAVAYTKATSGGAQTYQAFTTSGTAANCWTGLVVITGGTCDDHSPVWSTNAVVTTGTGAPNPGQANLKAQWDFLVCTVAAWHLSSAATVTVSPPSGYAEAWEIAGSQTSELSLASKAVTGAGSDDPGAYTDNVTPNGSCSITFAVVMPAGDSKPRGIGSAFISNSATSVAMTVDPTPGNTGAGTGRVAAAPWASASSSSPETTAAPSTRAYPTRRETPTSPTRTGPRLPAAWCGSSHPC
jgi:hypothetical protein